MMLLGRGRLDAVSLLRAAGEIPEKTATCGHDLRASGQHSNNAVCAVGMMKIIAFVRSGKITSGFVRQRRET
jgi:hypothetical protein